MELKLNLLRAVFIGFMVVLALLVMSIFTLVVIIVAFIVVVIFVFIGISTLDEIVDFLRRKYEN